MANRDMPICLTNEQYQKILEYAKKNGMLNVSQAIEEILRESTKS